MGYWREDVIRRIIEERISERIRGITRDILAENIKEQALPLEIRVSRMSSKVAFTVARLITPDPEQVVPLTFIVNNIYTTAVLCKKYNRCEVPPTVLPGFITRLPNLPTDTIPILIHAPQIAELGLTEDDVRHALCMWLREALKHYINTMRSVEPGRLQWVAVRMLTMWERNINMQGSGVINPVLFSEFRRRINNRAGTLAYLLLVYCSVEDLMKELYELTGKTPSREAVKGYASELERRFFEELKERLQRGSGGERGG